MSQIIQKFSDGSILEYDQGKFDRWCVYLTRNGNRYAPIDVEYFTKFQNLSTFHGSEKIYNDFIKVFGVTGKNIDPDVLRLIQEIARGYDNNSLEIEKLLVIVYAGMIAEENKAFSRLGKRIKRLGMHQVLMEKMSPTVAANYSKGKSWRNLDAEMKLKGF